MHFKYYIALPTFKYLKITISKLYITATYQSLRNDLK